MVPKQQVLPTIGYPSFRAVLFRMVPKRLDVDLVNGLGFRAVLFRMVPKQHCKKS
ncbi:hypothetical protein HMPREF1044_0115 [Streptococcus constellatus subsp. constellatus SK53]|uniref:Uncharacterized protein n=1 Tax=Streptococcus constellatus subsp. constellatus SK53 TaxID=1095730 RepID=A0AAD2SXJ2_STRCV|nr:hypothetical protein HMPREF1044_0115 [Streptococcus constellatus subsp. constellatus SK53]BBD22961.1 hypothetical protein SCSC_1288 [Streptococcus constellatus subsp. constellatus]